MAPLNPGPAARRRRICVVATVPFAIRVFMRAHVERLSRDYEVSLVTNGEPEELADLLGTHVAFRRVAIVRKISVASDLRALFSLWRYFRQERFDAVHSIMPKSGLLAMLAARLAGVPLRVHVFTGQVWATASGPRRWLLRLADTVLAMNATRVLADSRSQRAFLIDNGVIAAADIDVLAGGSVAGVDVARFDRSAEARARIRAERKIPDPAVVFLFLGRLTRDKGLHDLAVAFADAAGQDGRVHLFVVGPDEEGLGPEVDLLGVRVPGRVHRVGFVARPEDYISAADVLCLPSYREGFGSVIIEAASGGLPAIASRIYGVTDAVIDGVTGILHAPGGTGQVTAAMLRLAADEPVRSQMGAAARRRARDEFSETRVTTALAELYRGLFSGSTHA